jgi:type II secretory pathway pseudopilin PulG
MAMMKNRRGVPASARSSRTVGQRDGFTMIALMVAVVLLATGVMAIGAANTTRIRSQTVASSKDVALNVARQHLENLRGGDPWSIASETGVQVNASGVASATGEFTRSVTVTVERSNLITIEVIVQGPRLAQPVTLITNAYRGGTMTPRT